MVKELAQVLDMFRLVVIGPFIGVMNAQPFIMAGNLTETSEGTMRMHRIGEAGHDISRNMDVLQLGYLILPVGIQERMGHDHARLVFNVILAGKGFKNSLWEYGIGDAAAIGCFAEMVNKAFPWRNGR